MPTLLIGAVLLVASGLAVPVSATAADIVHDAEYYILEAQNGERWAAEDKKIDAKLAELKGTPVVVNQWASWCEPCRAEFPFFADSANVHQGEIAFVGIDMQDDRGAAETFLSEFPVSYPSIWDPDASAIASLGGGVVSPTTAFVDEKGEVTHVFQGSYATRDQLEADIEEHLPSTKKS